MSKKEKNGRKPGLWFEIVSSVILISLSMLLGIALFCHEWREAIANSLYIILWALWYRAQKAKTQLLYENRHLKEMLYTTAVGLVAVRKMMEDDDEDEDDNKGDNANAEANKDNNDGQEAK